MDILFLLAADNAQVEKQGKSQSSQGQKTALKYKNQGGYENQQEKEHLHTIAAVHLLKI